MPLADENPFREVGIRLKKQREKCALPIVNSPGDYYKIICYLNTVVALGNLRFVL